jgi:sugar/nucleoside kinase (ribokinase family)
MTPIDYLAVGHVCRDVTPDGFKLGGSVSFSSLTALTFGINVAILTSAPMHEAADLLAPLHNVSIEIVDSPEFTTFQNIYTEQGRTQTLLGYAKRITPVHIPPPLRSASIAHLAPVADEVDPALAESFPNALIGLTPQGWMRQWDSSGRVSFQRWKDAPRLLERADATVMSIEDVHGDEALANEYAHLGRIFVVTRGEQGCTLFVESKTWDIPAPRVEVADPTGAGDIFAASFFICLKMRGDPLWAAQTATQLASASVARVGLNKIPSVQEVREALS